ncbi:FG-GAP-like repeat-containing protein [Micromonospora ureilytica]|uniref:FG-GAP-like repeat-containing protein n=1 Tax=Micromonospora ureilytica TaxID=709868 RepID=UPI002E14A0B5|nr:FG-GAP-like repeat-containing protein [Micromonospora ureilytica]
MGHRSRWRRWLSAVTTSAVAAVGLVAVDVVAGPASPALATPEDRVTGQWNMQGQNDGAGGAPQSRWTQEVTSLLLTDGIEVLALQEAGSNAPAHVTNTGRVFPGLVAQEYLWRPDTRSTYYIYWGVVNQQRNGLAFVVRADENGNTPVTNVVSLAMPGAVRPIIGIEVNGEDWYFNTHATAIPGARNNAPGIVTRVVNYMDRFHPGAEYMLMADFNRDPGDMPPRRQNRLITTGEVTHLYSYTELDYAYSSSQNNNTVIAERSGRAVSDHIAIRYRMATGCRPGAIHRREVTKGCDGPIPGERYRFFAPKLDDRVLSYAVGHEDPAPLMRHPTGAGAEAVRVLFSSFPGRYLLAFDNDQCVQRRTLGQPLGTATCDPKSADQTWLIGEDAEFISEEHALRLQAVVGDPQIYALGWKFPWHFEPFEPQGLRARDLRLLPLGDSITHGVGGSPAGTGYRAHLWNLLSDNPGSLDFVGSADSGDLSDTDHEGHPGWRIDRIHELVSDCTMRRYRPNVVALHIGTNDLRSSDGADTAPDRLRALIERIVERAPETTVLVATLVPSLDSATNARIQQYNARIPGIVEELDSNGLPVRLVDMNAVTTADMTDGLHPNNNGYRKMAEAYDRAVESALAEGLIRPPMIGDNQACGSSTTPPTSGPRPEGWTYAGQIASGVNVDRTQVRLGDFNGDGRADYAAVGDQGQVKLWLNRRSGNGIGWDYRGQVAAGAGPRDQIRFADINGDDRDDYLVVGDQGEVQGWLNTGTGDAVSWTAKGVVASGVGATGDQVIFADIDVDGRDDYLVVGDQGQVRAWLNAFNANGAGWKYQGQIASGVNVDRKQVRFGDIDGDGRDDYLTVNDQAQVRGWRNDIGGSSGRSWVYQGDVAGGVGATSAALILADVNGDGRDDYLVVGEQGEINAWYNDRYGRPDPWDWQGLIATSGAPHEQVRLADLNGDGRDDYLVAGSQGQVSAWLNVRNGSRVGWNYRGTVATGSGPRDQLRFADLNGDNRDDYLIVGDLGQITAWLNTGTGNQVAWTSIGEVATGSGPRDQLRFADLNGDNRDDYLIVGDLGQVTAWLNTGTGNQVAWTSQGGVADGVGAAGSTVRFADVNGDRRDDYLVLGEHGQLRAWLNNRGGVGSAWLSRGEIGSGVGYRGSQVELAEINGDRRADYLILDDQGGVRAWFNNQAAGGPVNPAPMPTDPETPPPGNDDGAPPDVDIDLCVANRCFT